MIFEMEKKQKKNHLCFYKVDFGRIVKSWANALKFNELKPMTSFRVPSVLRDGLVCVKHSCFLCDSGAASAVLVSDHTA